MGLETQDKVGAVMLVSIAGYLVWALFLNQWWMS